MPFTPYHWGIALLVGRRFDSGDRFRVTIISLIMITIPDIEGFANVIMGIPVEIHGPLHSLPVSIAISLLVALGLKIFFKKVGTIEFFVYVLIMPIGHILIDLLIYSDMKPLWPFTDLQNPMALPFGNALAILICLVAYFVWGSWAIWE